MCKTNKKEFDTFFDAKIRLCEINPNKESDKPIRVYKCEFCNKWHLTKITELEKQKFHKKINDRVKIREQKFIQRESEYYIKKFKLK